MRIERLAWLDSAGLGMSAQTVYDEKNRRRRRSGPRSSTLSPKLELKRHRKELASSPALDITGRPTTRGDCASQSHECPWVSCQHHLYLDVNPRTGSLKLNFPHIEPDELPIKCALDVVEEDGATLDRIGEVMNLCRERVRQIEVKALAKIRGQEQEYEDYD